MMESSSLTYEALAYQPTEEERQERIRLMRYWKARVADGTASPAAPAIHMARVYKKCPDKLTVLETG